MYMQKLMHFVCSLFYIGSKFKPFLLSKVVQQHNYGVMESVTWYLLQMLYAFQQ